MATLTLTRCGALALTLAGAAALAGETASATEPASKAQEFLRDQLGLRPNELARVGRGDVVVRMVEDPGFREIAVMAVVALPAAPHDWTSGFPLVERLRRTSPDLIALGRLGSPAALEELTGVQLDARVLPPLQKCRPQKCVVNASKGDIDRFTQEIDWTSDDPAGSANAVFRAVLHDRMVEYQRAGDAALPVLANRAWTLTTADAPLLLLDRRPSLAQLSPALDQHFRACTRGGANGGDDVYYWCR